MENRIKQLREERGLTQSQLAEKTQLSLRTIQRVEAKGAEAKGHTLNAISTFFQVDLQELQTKVDKNSLSKARIINTSVLLFIFFPLIHVFAPIIIWKKHKNDSFINEAGRQIISFQILWSIAFVLLIVISSFTQAALQLNPPLVLIVMLLLYVSNIIMICVSAYRLKNESLTPEIIKTSFRLI